MGVGLSWDSVLIMRLYEGTEFILDKADSELYSVRCTLLWTFPIGAPTLARTLPYRLCQSRDGIGALEGLFMEGCEVRFESELYSSSSDDNTLDVTDT